MYFIHKHGENGLDWLSAEGLTDEKAVHGFSTRLGGVSTGCLSSLNLGVSRGDTLDNVRENYRRFCGAIGAKSEGLVFSHQVHLDEVRVCTMEDAGKGIDRHRDYDADGLITDVPGLPLVIFSADCIPILFYDPVRRVVGGSHAGWRGTALGIAGKTVKKMQDVYGCRPADIRCAIGAGISRCCFETHADVPQAMLEAMGEDARPFIDTLPTGKYRVDLKGINAYWLEKAGILKEKIVISDDCTSCHPDIYWSHRHTGSARGSMAAVIQLL
jgi:YfiH family protein